MALIQGSPAGLQLVKVDDPTGNNQESYDLAYREPGSDALVYARLIVQRHAGGKLRFVHCGEWSGTSDVFETEDNKVVIVEA